MNGGGCHKLCHEDRNIEIAINAVARGLL